MPMLRSGESCMTMADCSCDYLGGMCNECMDATSTAVQSVHRSEQPTSYVAPGIAKSVRAAIWIGIGIIFAIEMICLFLRN